MKNVRSLVIVRLMAVLVIIGLWTSTCFASNPLTGMPKGIALSAELGGDSYREDQPSDNDGLFEGYIEKQLQLQAEAKRKSAQGSKLDGYNRAIYNALKPEIARVAGGERAATDFVLPIEELGLGDTSWSAEDLGVDSIVENNAITQAAADAAVKKLELNTGAIIRALLADCPYDLYWYDKTAGTTTFYPSISATHDGEQWYLCFRGSFTFAMHVAQAYAAGEYQVNTTNGQRVQHAVDKVADIVDDNKDKTDYEKLVSYRETICGLTAYDYAAADDENNTPYGDPWQIISVFDEDDSTNVVCEGYSKSFQYLCDRTIFRRDISCISVSGTMNGGTGEGPHMWNIVNMEDSANYLVDVTNCDEGTVGADDQLFLVGYESGSVDAGYTFICNQDSSILYTYADTTRADYANELVISDHNYAPSTDPCAAYGHAEMVIPEVPATCTEAGLSAGKKCSDCGVILEEQTVVEALGHDYIEVDGSAVAATCTEAGKEADQKCSRCDDMKEGAVIAATGHTEVEIPAVAATCNEKGSTAGKICSVCGEILEAPEEVATLGHDYETVEDSAVAATCEKAGKEADQKCSRCDSVIEGAVIEALGHDWGDWTVVKEATEDEEGLERRVCGRDESHKEERAIPKLNHIHNLKQTDAVAATCTEDGNIEYWTCSKCGKIYSDENGENDIDAEDTIIKAKGHTEEEIPAVAAACTEKGSTAGKKCSVCGEILEAPEEVAALGHDYKEVEDSAVAPTCIKAGKDADQKCSRCDDVKEGAVIAATGHIEEAIPAVAATCTEKGSTAGKKCSVCGEILESPEEVAALGHDYKEVENSAITPTCTKAGKEADQKCSRCDNVKEGAVIAATGHTEEEIPAVPATCTEKGSTAGKKCSACGEILEAPEEVAALGHDYEEVEDSAVAATCEKDGKKADQKCSRCDSIIEGAVIEALGHDWGDWTVVKEATEDEEGLERRVCGRDESHKEERAIPKLNHAHNLKKTDAVAATCTEDGNIEYWTCSKCGRIYSDESGENELNAEDTIVKAKGHTEEEIPAVPATCTEKGATEGKKCSICGGILEAPEEVAALGHDYEEVEDSAVAATCTKAGKEADQKCSRCDNVKEGAVIVATGHAEEEIPPVPATCTEKGSTAGKKCSVCGEILEAPEEVAALGHDYEEVEDSAVAATCTKAGKEADQKCSRCDNVKEGAVIAATGHTEEEIPAVAATCTEKGSTIGKKCSVCGEILKAPEEVAALGHDYEEVEDSAVAPTCTKAGKETDQKCSRCEIVIEGATLEALGHDWGEWAVVKEATEDEEGLERRICGRDESHKEERAIPKLNHAHNLKKTDAVAASCTEDGNIEYWTCSKCGRIYSEENGENEINTEDTIVKAKGHKEEEIPAVAATCTEKGSTAGKKCSVCGEILEAPEEVAALGHDYEEVENSAVAATCEKAGKKADQKCSRCDSIIEGAVIEALGHDWGEWTVVKEATEDEEGLERRVCGRDESHKEERTIPKLNHTHDFLKTDAVDATCTEDGNIEYWTCSKCGRIYSDESGENEINAEDTIVKAKGHKEEEIPAVAATCTEKGSTAGKKCSICGEILEVPEEVAALGHDWGNWTVVKEATEDEEGLERRVCGRDDSHKEERAIPKLNHTHKMEKVDAVAATYDAEGCIEHWVCSKCGKYFLDADGAFEVTPESVVIPKLEKGEEQTNADDAMAASDQANKDAAAQNEQAATQADAAIQSAESGDPDDSVIEEASAAAEEAVESAATALEDAQKALSAAKSAYGENSPQAADAESKVAQATAILSAAATTKSTATKASAVAATKKAEAAKAAAEKAAATPGAEAVAAAEAYKEAADIAVVKAEAFKAAAEAAYHTAVDALAVASDEEKESAQAAVTAAEKTAEDADAALTEAKSVARAADFAVSEAEAAKKEAEDAEKAAEEAKKAAEEAKKKADAEADLAKTNAGTTHTYRGARYQVLKNASAKAAGTVALIKSKNAKAVTVPAAVKLNGKTFTVTQINAKAFKGSKIRTVTIGKNVRVIKSYAFNGSKAAKLIVKTKKLKKATVKGSLKGSKVKTIQVKVGSKKVNKTYVKTYKKIFTKKNAGRKVTIQ